MKPSEALKPELKEVEVQVDNNELETLRGDLQASSGLEKCPRVLRVFVCLFVDVGVVCRKTWVRLWLK